VFQLIAENSDDKKEREHAKNIGPMRKRRNFLLCTLFIGNMVVNSMIMLLNSNLFDQPPLNENAVLPITVIVPSVAIVVLAEIIPQALCHRCVMRLPQPTTPPLQTRSDD
jgi:metal transporter CNNM